MLLQFPPQNNAAGCNGYIYAGSTVTKDGGKSDLKWVLLVNEDYPLYINNGYRVPEDLPSGEKYEIVTLDYVTPRFMKKYWNELHVGLPTGYRHMYIEQNVDYVGHMIVLCHKSVSRRTNVGSCICCGTRNKAKRILMSKHTVYLYNGEK